jgi:hypothetical protein
VANRYNHTRESLQQTDYSAAIARAVEWLGNRYLLAKPMMPRSHQRNRLISSINREH